MPRNVEIKARARDFKLQAQTAERFADSGPRHFVQEDTFFNVPVGRLKLRIFEDGSGELIQYDREDSLAPKESFYARVAVGEPAALKEVLARTIGIRAVVRKKRTVYLSGQTRIHFDDVEGLGKFIELEVVLESGEDFSHGAAIAEKLMSRLDIQPSDLIARAYVDLLPKL